MPMTDGADDLRREAGEEMREAEQAHDFKPVLLLEIDLERLLVDTSELRLSLVGMGETRSQPGETRDMRQVPVKMTHTGFRLALRVRHEPTLGIIQIMDDNHHRSDWKPPVDFHSVQLFDFSTSFELRDELLLMLIQKLLGSEVYVKERVHLVNSSDLRFRNLAVPAQFFRCSVDRDLVLVALVNEVSEEIKPKVVEKLFAWFVNSAERKVKLNAKGLIRDMFGKKK